MTCLRKGDCIGQTAQNEKTTFDQASGCVQREDRVWKYQKMSIVGGLACRFSRVAKQSEAVEAGNYSREKRV